jgi:hypothetical protein
MGNECSKSIPVKQKNNIQHKIGQKITIPNACSPYGSAKSQMTHLIPDNGEYEWAGEGEQCYYCSLESPNSVNCAFGCVDTNCCSIIGVSGKYRRKSTRQIQ